MSLLHLPTFPADQVVRTRRPTQVPRHARVVDPVHELDIRRDPKDDLVVHRGELTPQILRHQPRAPVSSALPPARRVIVPQVALATQDGRVTPEAPGQVV